MGFFIIESNLKTFLLVNFAFCLNSVCANNCDWIAGFPFCTNSEGDDGAGIAGKVVLAAGLEGGGP